MSASSHAQNSSNIRTREIDITKDSIHLDSLLILPATIRLQVANEFLDSTYYHLNLAKGIFIPKAKLKAKATKARISYRVFNYKVAQLQYKHHTNEINKPDVLRGKRYSLAQNTRSQGNDFI